LVLICWISLLKRRLFRKESKYVSSTALSLVRKWGPSIRNVIRSIKSTAKGDNDSLERAALKAAIQAWEHFKQHPKQDLSALAMEGVGSDLIFLRRKPTSKSIGEQCIYYYIPTPHLRDIFEQHRQGVANQDFLNLYFNLSSHALTRTSAGWIHENLMH
jgi:hypothetical protein